LARPRVWDREVPHFRFFLGVSTSRISSQRGPEAGRNRGQSVWGIFATISSGEFFSPPVADTGTRGRKLVPPTGKLPFEVTVNGPFFWPGDSRRLNCGYLSRHDHLAESATAVYIAASGKCPRMQRYPGHTEYPRPAGANEVNFACPSRARGNGAKLFYLPPPHPGGGGGGGGGFPHVEGPRGGRPT